MGGGGGGHETFPLLQKGAQNVLPCLEVGGGGGTKSMEPAIFPFCKPPLPVINDRSLRGVRTKPPVYHLRAPFVPKSPCRIASEPFDTQYGGKNKHKDHPRRRTLYESFRPYSAGFIK